MSRRAQTTRTQAAQAGRNAVLFIQDTTELDFTAQRQTHGLGHIGDTKGRGFELHSCLAVIPTRGNPEIFGVAAQTVWTTEQVHRKTKLAANDTIVAQSQMFGQR